MRGAGFPAPAVDPHHDRMTRARAGRPPVPGSVSAERVGGRTAVVGNPSAEPVGGRPVVASNPSAEPVCRRPHVNVEHVGARDDGLWDRGIRIEPQPLGGGGRAGGVAHTLPRGPRQRCVEPQLADRVLGVRDPEEARHPVACAAPHPAGGQFHADVGHGHSVISVGGAGRGVAQRETTQRETWRRDVIEGRPVATSGYRSSARSCSGLFGEIRPGGTSKTVWAPTCPRALSRYTARA